MHTGSSAAAAGAVLVVDARSLHASGIGRYLRGVLRAVLADERFRRVVLLGHPRELAAFVRDCGATTEVRIEAHTAATYSPRAQLRWLDLHRRGRLDGDVYFFPHYDAPLVAPRGRSVVTIHDLTHFKVPDLFPAWKRAMADLLLRRVTARAARVITVSESSRSDLEGRFPAVAGKVEVIPNGVESHFSPWSGAAPPRPEWGALGRYLLVVGNRKPHKNLALAVEALALLRERSDVRLVVAGGHTGDDWERVARLGARLGVGPAIVDAGRVSDAELRFLYSRCDALLFPSLYEGFGLPVLEAMACGAPVVASNTSSLPEVVGDAGMLIDPHDAARMAAEVGRLRDDAPLRAEMVRRGHERALLYTAESAARATIETLLEVARRAG